MTSTTLRPEDTSASAGALLFYYPAAFLIFFADILIVDFPGVRIGLLDVLPAIPGVSWAGLGAVFAALMLLTTVRYVAGGGTSDLARLFLRAGHSIIVLLSFIGFLVVPMAVTLSGLSESTDTYGAFVAFRGSFFFLLLFVLSGMSHAFLATGRTDRGTTIVGAHQKLLAAQMAMLSAVFLFLVLNAPGALASLSGCMAAPSWLVFFLPVCLVLMGAIFASFGGGAEHGALLGFMFRLCVLLSAVAPVAVLLAGRSEESGMALYMAALALFVAALKGVYAVEASEKAVV